MAKKSKTKEGVLDALRMIDELTLPKDEAKKIDSESNKYFAGLRKRELRIVRLFPAIGAVNKAVEGIKIIPGCGDDEFEVLTPKQGAYLGGKYSYNTSSFGRKLDKPCTGAYRDKENDFSEFERQIQSACNTHPDQWHMNSYMDMYWGLDRGLMLKSVKARIEKAHGLPIVKPDYEAVLSGIWRAYQRNIEQRMKSYKHLTEESQEIFRERITKDNWSAFRDDKRKAKYAGWIIDILNNPKQW